MIVLCIYIYVDVCVFLAFFSLKEGCAFLVFVGVRIFFIPLLLKALKKRKNQEVRV